MGVSDPGPPPMRSPVVTVQATVTVTVPPRWKLLVSTVTCSRAQRPARLAVAALSAAVVAVEAVRDRDAAREAAAAAELTSMTARPRWKAPMMRKTSGVSSSTAKASSTVTEPVSRRAVLGGTRHRGPMPGGRRRRGVAGIGVAMGGHGAGDGGAGDGDGVVGDQAPAELVERGGGVGLPGGRGAADNAGGLQGVVCGGVGDEEAGAPGEELHEECHNQDQPGYGEGELYGDRAAVVAATRGPLGSGQVAGHEGAATCRG